MDRRNFLQAMATAVASLEFFGSSAVAADPGPFGLAA